MLWKCCTQDTSKFGKLSNGHRTGKGQFSFQSQRRAMPKNVQTTPQLPSFNILARLCSKSFKLGFNTTWTKNFQMHKLNLRKGRGTRYQIANICWILEKATELGKKKIYFLFTMLKPLTVWITTNWKILKEMGIPKHLACLLRNLYAGQETTVRIGHGTMDRFKIGKGVHQSFIFSSCLLNICRVHLAKCQAGWSTSWNQDCREKYQ